MHKGRSEPEALSKAAGSARCGAPRIVILEVYRQEDGASLVALARLLAPLGQGGTKRLHLQ